MFDSQTYLFCETCGEYVNESEAEAHENSCESRQASHTPGPWYEQPSAGHERHGQSIVASERTGKTIAVVYDGNADAQLIAAAPDLLAALRNLFDDWVTLVGEDLREENDDVKRIWDSCEAAITQAQGDQ
jgi:hypothetical protein